MGQANPALAGEQIIEFVGVIGSSFEHIDPLSRRILTAVRKSIRSLAQVFSCLNVSSSVYTQWLERLAPLLEQENDRGRCIHELAIVWGELCKNHETATHWADRLIPQVRHTWINSDYSRASSLACLSSLAASQRWTEILELLAQRSIGFWPEQRFGVLALAALGKLEEALQYARHANPLGHEYQQEIAVTCESILLAHDFRQRAYQEFAIIANQRQNHLHTFRALAAKYPEIAPEKIFEDLIHSTPGEEGKWFRVAYELRFFQLAVEIAQHASCDPKTLLRVATEQLSVDPSFAQALALACLRCLSQGYGVAVTANDVYKAYDIAMQAVTSEKEKKRMIAILRQYSEGPNAAAQWLRELLARELSLT